MKEKSSGKDSVYAYVPKELKTAVKIKVAQEGITISHAVEQLLRKWVDGEVDLR